MDQLSENEKFRTILSCIEKIPAFSGNKLYLANFLERIDSLCTHIETLADDYKRIIIGAIQDKIVGSARNSILAKGLMTTWLEYRSALVEFHGEYISTSNLMDSLVLCRCNTSVSNFYKTITSILSRLNNAHILDNSLTEDQSLINNRIALKTFKDNLPEPLRGIMFNREPTNLQDCFKIIISTGYANLRVNVNYVQNSNITNYQGIHNYKNDRGRQHNNFLSNHTNYINTNTRENSVFRNNYTNGNNNKSINNKNFGHNYVNYNRFKNNNNYTNNNSYNMNSTDGRTPYSNNNRRNDNTYEDASMHSIERYNNHMDVGLNEVNNFFFDENFQEPGLDHFHT